MWSIARCLSLIALLGQAQALYFYIDGATQKCFFEELPKDTLVVGMQHGMRAHGISGLTDWTGHYKATQWNEQARSYIENSDMVLQSQSQSTCHVLTSNRAFSSP